MPVTTDPNVEEADLWAAFDNATLDKKTNKKLNRNKNDTEQHKDSKRHDYRKNLVAAMTANPTTWTDVSKAEVIKCATKAGNTARLLAQHLGKNNCTLEIFNLACTITEQAYRIDTANNPQAMGIIC